MTTAAKFGAQDLNGNPFNYQQIVAPVTSNNVVVNTNFTNRNGADARVRLAVTSVPLVSQTVASTQGLYPIVTTTSATSTNITTTQTLTIANTTIGTNALTTAIIGVTSTAVTTNLITCVSTATLSVGQPVVFTGNMGNLVAGTTYFIQSIPGLTTFVVSTINGGFPFVLTTAAGSIGVQQTTANLLVNEPIMFTGIAFGGVTTGLTYYVLTITSSTTFTISLAPSSPAVILFTSSGILTLGYTQSTAPSVLALSSTASGSTVNTLQALTITASTTSTNVLTTAITAVSATTSGTNVITIASTALYTVGQPVVFSGALGNIVSGTIYYVLSIPSSTTFTISPTWNGAVFILATASGSINCQQSTTNIVVGQPLVFWGATFGNVVAGITYYVQSIASTSSFTLAPIQGGLVYPLITTTGTMVASTPIQPSTINISSTAASITAGGIAVSATTTATNLITVATTATLAVGMPIMFSSSIGGILPNTTYYVLAIAGLTTFTVSTWYNGSVLPLTTATGSVTVYPEQLLNITASTTGTNILTTSNIIATNTTTGTNLITCSTTSGFYVGMPVIFGSVFGGLVATSQYYILTLNSATQFTVSLAYNGAVVALSTASGTMTVQQATTSLQVNQPVTFASYTPTQTFNIASTTAGTNVLVTAAIAVTATTTGTNLITTVDTSSLIIGQPVLFSGALGNLASATVYYVYTIISGTQFTVSAVSIVNGGTVYALTTTSGSITYSQATTTLIVNQPIIFSGTTYGNIVAGTTYYVQAIATAVSFTISSTAAGSSLTLTNASGTMFGAVTYPTVGSLTITGTTTGTNVLSTASIAISNTTTGTNLITCASTTALSIGQPFTISVALGGLLTSTTYYVQTIPSATTFTASATLNGVVFALTTAATVSALTLIPTFVTGQPVVFAGTTFGNIVAGTVYYVLTNTGGNFSVSTLPYGTVFALTTATGTMTTNPTILGGLLSATTYYINSIVSNVAFTISTTLGGAQYVLPTTTGLMRSIFGPSVTTNANILTTTAVAVTATTTGTNVITASATGSLAIGQAVVFSGSLGGLIAGTIYYVLTVPTATTFTVSALFGGTTFVLTTASGTITVQQATTNLQINQPITFTSTLLPLTIAATTATTNALTTATISVTNTTVTTNLITAAATSTLLAGMPVVFSSSLGNLIGGTTYYVAAVSSITQFTVSTTLNGAVFALATASGTITVQQLTTNLVVNQPIVFTGTTFGNIVANTTYYVSSITNTTSFVLATAVNGPIFALATSTGSMTANLSTIGGIVSYTTYYVQNIVSPTTFSISATYAGIPFVLSNSTGAMTGNIVLPVSSVTISNSTTTTNVLTTASVSVTATATATNLITCASTATFVVNTAVVFNGGLGNLLAGVVYYITSIPSSTTFTVSATFNGVVFPLVTATGTVNVQQATTALMINQPVVFTGTAFGNIVLQTTYYVQSIVSQTTFTIAAAYAGGVFALTTASGTMQSLIGPQSMLTISNTTVTSNVITTNAFNVTATSGGTNLITVQHTYFLSVGMPVTFSASNGNLIAGVVYYVQSIPTAVTFSVSTTLGGLQFILINSAPTMTVSQTTTGLTLNQAVIFTGATFGNIIAATTYYVQSIVSLTTFTISAAPAGAAFVLTTASGFASFNAMSSNIVAINSLNMAPIAVTATAVTTNIITCASASLLAINQPVVFSGTLGNLVAGTTYYVLSILSPTTFTVSTLVNGVPFVQITATGSVNVQQSTLGLAINQAIVFSPTIAAITISNTTVTSNVITTAVAVVTATTATTNIITTASTSTFTTGQSIVFSGSLGNLIGGSIYYVLTILNSTQFTVASVLNGPVFALATASGSVNVQQATTGWAINQPIIFAGTGFGNLAAATPYFIQSVVSTSTFTVSATYNGAVLPLITATGAMTGTFTGFGNIVANTIYYIQSIPSATTLIVSSIYGGPASILTLGNGSVYGTILPEVPSITVGATTTGTNLLTMLAITVSATSIGTNLITCNSTLTMVYGQPVVFSGTLGNLIGGTIYYIAGILNNTQFFVSATWNGPQFVQIAASGSVTVQPTTTNFVIGQPIVFTGTVFGNHVYGTTYYILTINSATTFTVTATQYSPVPFALATGTGTMIGDYGPSSANTISNTTITSNVLTTYSTPVTATSLNGINLITCANTYIFAVGMPVAFSASLGSLAANTVYYIQSIPNAITFTVSLIPGGPVLPLSSVTGTVNVQQVVSNLWLNQSIIFGGNVAGVTTFGGIANGTTYYVQSIASLTTFTVSLTPGGSAVSLSTAVSTSFNTAMNFNYSTMPVTVSNVYLNQTMPINGTTTTSNILTTGQLLTAANIPVVITATATSGIITCNSTYPLSQGLPIVLSSGIAGLSSATTYYVLAVLSPTTFTIANTWGGQLVILTTSVNQGVTLQPSTATLTVGEPLIATGVTFGNVVANNTYYVNTIVSATTFTITATQNSGTPLALTTQTGYMYITASTGFAATGSVGNASLVANAPIMFSGATITITNISGTILTTTGNTSWLVVNQPVMFTGYTIGGILPNIYYYVQSIPSFNTVTLSATINGPALSWTTTSNTMTAQIVNGFGLAAGVSPYATYYVQAVQSPSTFSISLASGGTVSTLVNGLSTMVVNSNICTLATGGSTAYLAANQLVTFTGTGFGNIQSLPTTTLPFIVTNTTVSTNLITVSSTATLIVGQPVIFLGTTWGGIVAYQTYYILAVSNSTQFTISLTPGGTVVTLATVASATSTPSFYMIPAYYVKAIISPTQFVVSASPGGAMQQLITALPLGGNVLLATGQPVFTDFMEYDALIAANGVLERTGIILPPNTYLYASSNISQVSAIAIGIQEAV